MKRLLVCFVLLLAATTAYGQLIPQPGCAAAYPTTGGVPPMSATAKPDYMSGCVPNYANSPLPKVSGGISSITLVSGGVGYSATPTVTIDPPAVAGTQATATATVTNGVITALTLTNPGAGYTYVPAVTITDPTGEGADASVTVPVVAGTGMRKFVDTLPGLCGVAGGTNNLNQCIPLATPDTTTFQGSDFYRIGLQDYTKQMHSDLPATRLRGYVQLDATNSAPATANQYLGPLILATRNRPVRFLFKNSLGPAGGTGDLFVPVDTTYMGAGVGPDGATNYTQNRAVIHLHGGNTPWISDGTPHQWVTPAGENTSYKKGVSFQNVPDMVGANSPIGLTNPTDSDGLGTYFYTNQQSGRLMFFHEHAYGTTRLGVYSGIAGGYLLVDPQQESLLAAATVPGTVVTDPNTGAVVSADLTHLVPLIIQDKTFVPDTTPGGQLNLQDPTWDTTKWGGFGSLWFPHVYMPNQDPSNTQEGANPMGRWDYGPWFWPPQDPSTFVAGGQPYPCAFAVFPGQLCPGTPTPAGVPEAFLDTPVVNGTAYPVLHVAPAAYRFQILNAANDRFLNLQLYQAVDSTGAVCTSAPATPGPGSTTPSTCTEVKFVQNLAGIAGQGPMPDPLTKGPNMVQIGTEGGLLPAPVVLTNTAIQYNYNRRDIVVLNVAAKNLFLGPAERADVIVDFSQFAGKTLILYNDAPAPVPAFDTRIDYYTGAPDQTDTGGAPSPQPGYGPNTRTIMQIVVDGTGSNSFNLATLQAQLPAIFAATQDPPVVPEKAYGAAQNNYVRIQDTTFSYAPDAVTPPTTASLLPKAIQELFTLDYGRMNATLGVEVPFTNFLTQTTIPYGYVDPPTELFKDGETQIWKITHNGVDTHAMHFHLFNVQVINRVGWDGAIRPPDPNELSWKDTVRMNPLEDAIVAFKAVKQTLPFQIPNSTRLLDVSSLPGATDAMRFTNVDPTNQPAVVTNDPINFGWEYVWHCHLLGHEENDMMRPMILAVPPNAPVLTATKGTGTTVNLAWTEASIPASFTGFTVQRSSDATFPAALTQTLATFPSATSGTFSDTTAPLGSISYRVIGSNLVGYTKTFAGTVGYPSVSADSVSNVATIAVVVPTTTTINAPAITFGQNGVVTVTVTSSITPVTGTVTLSVDGGAALTATLTNGSATFTLTQPAVGAHTLLANYAAQGTFGASSATGTLTVSNAALAIDVNTVRTSSTANTTITTPAFTTKAANELLLAFIASDGPASGTNVRVTGVTGGGLTWTLVRRTNVQLGTAEIWRAFAPAVLTNVTVRATLSVAEAAQLNVLTFTGVDTTNGGANAVGATGSGNAITGAPTASLVTTRANSWVFGVGVDWDRAVNRTVGPNQTIVRQFLPTVGDTYWVQRQNNPTPTAGTTVRINDTAPTNDRWNLTTVEVRTP